MAQSLLGLASEFNSGQSCEREHRSAIRRKSTVEHVIAVGFPLPTQFSSLLIVEAYWAAFAQQIRTVRNDVGHPSSVDPVTPDTVHASLLIFPELAKLQNKLTNWVKDDLL
jgi:hypothetical protein